MNEQSSSNPRNANGAGSPHPLEIVPARVLIMALEQMGMNKGLAEARLAALSLMIPPPPRQTATQADFEGDEMTMGYDPQPKEAMNGHGV